MTECCTHMVLNLFALFEYVEFIRKKQRHIWYIRRDILNNQVFKLKLNNNEGLCL